MQWSVVGWTHHRSPIEIREKLAFTGSEVVETLQEFRDKYTDLEAVLLSTCNRVEFYCAGRDESKFPSLAEIGDFVAKSRGMTYEQVSEQADLRSAESMLHHLFKVASSLDSMIVGEAQILSQVKEAYELACTAGSTSTLLNRAFQRATTVAKRVANETEIHRKRVSVPSVAVSEIATEFFERFDDKQILLIGAGDMGTETLRYFIDAGAKKLRIINRNRERGQELAAQFEAQSIPWEDLDTAIGESDLIVSTTSSTEPIVTLERMKKIRSRRSRAVLILDMAVPRDFESTVGDMSDVYLFTVDDLQQVCERNIQARKKEWPKAERIVEEETTKFLKETKHHGSGPTIKRLREQAQEVKSEEFERLIGRLKAKSNGEELDAKLEKELAMSFDRLVNKLLHPPLQSLRENADSQHHATLLDSLRRLFQIND